MKNDVIHLNVIYRFEDGVINDFNGPTCLDIDTVYNPQRLCNKLHGD